MSEQKLEFKLEGPDSRFYMAVSKVSTSFILTAVTNFNTKKYPDFTRNLRNHPYVKAIEEMIDFRSDEMDGYVLEVNANYSAEIFNEDLATLMEMYIYENTETVATGVTTEN